MTAGARHPFWDDPFPQLHRTESQREAQRQLSIVAPDRDQARLDQIHESAEFGAVFTAAGETMSYAALAPVAAEAQEQFELNLTGLALHAAIRDAFARALGERVLPLCGAAWVHRYMDQLRGARHRAQIAYSLKAGKFIARWETKAGLARLCPDDAREEALRVNRRYAPKLQALQASGKNLYYAVLTTPNVAQGGLRKEMAGQFKRFKKLLKAKFPDGSLRFPEIEGALVVQEAPLGRSRDWNVHLNVVFVTEGFLDFGKLRRFWHWDVHLEKLASDENGNTVRSALAELIKYAVAATVAKSAKKADGTQAPPAMLDWTGGELLEWLRAMRGFRRTRAYGCLFKTPKPPKEDLAPLVWLGVISRRGDEYLMRCPLLDSIPGDKSLGTDPRRRLEAFYRSLAPGGIAGAAALFDRVPQLLPR